ncbi:hypothetical protein E0504_13165 [Parafrankia sp. BMG5.11]|nr:hypothetical protein E0504_13165 [Parafrankia sp. BMG5.11]
MVVRSSAPGRRTGRQESIAFVYADGDDAWLDGDAPVAGGGVTTCGVRGSPARLRAEPGSA